MHQLIELLTSGTKIALLQAPGNIEKQRTQTEKRITSMCTALRLVEYLKYHTKIIHALVLATWRYLNSKKRYVLLHPCTHMANILQPP